MEILGHSGEEIFVIGVDAVAHPEAGQAAPVSVESRGLEAKNHMHGQKALMEYLLLGKLLARSHERHAPQCPLRGLSGGLFAVRTGLKAVGEQTVGRKLRHGRPTQAPQWFID